MRKDKDLSEEYEKRYVEKWRGKIKSGWEDDREVEPGVAFCFDFGWYPLVDKLIEDLFQLGWDGCVAQTKEKFGGLRFYIGGASMEVFDRVDKAEQDSYKICEVCGMEGKGRWDLGWVKTLCKEHYFESLRLFDDFKDPSGAEDNEILLVRRNEHRKSVYITFGSGDTKVYDLYDFGSVDWEQMEISPNVGILEFGPITVNVLQLEKKTKEEE